MWERSRPTAARPVRDISLWRLGERERGTARLEEGVAAFDACLTVIETVLPAEWVQKLRSRRDGTFRLPCALDCGRRVGLTDTKTTTGASSNRDRRPLNPEFAASKVNLALARGVNRFMPSCVDAASVPSTTARWPAGVPLLPDPPYPSPLRTAQISAIEVPGRFRVVPARPTALPNQPRFGVPMIVRLGDGSNQATG